MMQFDSTSTPLDREQAIESYYFASEPITVLSMLHEFHSGKTVYRVTDGLKRTEAPGVPYRVTVSRGERPTIACDCCFASCGHIGAVLIERAAMVALCDAGLAS